ncbi:uncharacterized protein EAE97_007432 [Botrytis byssoidea]|uniref:Uncharacterized protein n=1 Tax=Botrytis byssoidea TaxID=139641 RepID=A0A9P5IHI6_9HELO|nr:uncharacterized protein EAE97_007432 [Botrytis byssoidea]KAF7939352.1 hypothetical protein EAE97_007432 [Botrytis byssoidea]
MPNLQQQQRNRRARLHAIQEEQNWLHTMQRTYLGLAMTRYARELILERRNRNYHREVHDSQTPRLNITLASRSLILTIAEPHLQKVLAYILLFVFGCILGSCVQMTCVYFMISRERVNATVFLFLGRVYLLWVCNLLRMWHVEMGDLRFRLAMTGYMSAIGLVLWILATWQSVKIF